MRGGCPSAMAKKEREGRVMNTNGVRFDKRDRRGEITFLVVSTVGMEKKHGLNSRKIKR